jgi:hypothetical protein
VLCLRRLGNSGISEGFMFRYILQEYGQTADGQKLVQHLHVFEGTFRFQIQASIFRFF